MRIKEPFTEFQERFILENRRDLTYQQIADSLGLKSVYRVNTFCKQHDINHRITDLTEQQEQSVLDIYPRLKDSVICCSLGITRFQLKKFKRKAGLVKKPGRKIKKAVVKDGFFDVDNFSKFYAV